MAHRLEQLLERATDAVRAQSWREAWALLEEINPDYRPDSQHLGALRDDFELVAATVLRHRGQLDQAQRLYDELLMRLALNDQRIVDVVIGLADVAHLRGDHGTAAQLVRAAEQMPVNDPVLALRLHTCAAHLESHRDLPRALQRFAWIEQNIPAQHDTAWANMLFWHGDTQLVAGHHEQAVKLLLASNQLASATGATITLADSMRRLPLARVLCGQLDFALRGLGDLNHAESLYDLAGDRGKAYLHTEAGEVFRAIGRLREAERAFSKGLWASRDIKDLNRQAHNQLGLFEISRQAGRPQHELVDDAERLYDKTSSDWGMLHVQLARALADGQNRPQHLRRATDIVERSTFASFEREQQMIAWIATAAPEALRNEPHLMNYP